MRSSDRSGTVVSTDSSDCKSHYTSIGYAAMAEAFLKWGGPKPMTRFSSSTTEDGSGIARNLKKRGGHNFHIFSSVSFSAELI